MSPLSAWLTRTADALRRGDGLPVPQSRRLAGPAKELCTRLVPSNRPEYHDSVRATPAVRGPILSGVIGGRLPLHPISDAPRSGEGIDPQSSVARRGVLTTHFPCTPNVQLGMLIELREDAAEDRTARRLYCRAFLGIFSLRWGFSSWLWSSAASFGFGKLEPPEVHSDLRRRPELQQVDAQANVELQ